MENNNPHDELLIEYLVSDLAADEKAFVENWISASEENRRYFESLKTAWKLAGEEKALAYVLDELNVDDKWNQIKQAMAGKEAGIVSINEQINEEGEDQQQGLSRRSGVYRLLVQAAIAASVLLVIGLGWKFLAGNNQDVPLAKNTEIKKDSLAFVVRHEVNTTGKEKRIQLQDGSLVVLAINSEVTYREPFTDRRDITLIGKAFFKVAKDKTRPFTVTSSEISTTALGTEFTVTAFKNEKQIIVRLYEGKVVIKAVNKANKSMKSDVYLLPGQSFIYDDQVTAKVKQFKLKKSAAPEEIMHQELLRDNPSLPKDADAPYFMFNNRPLGEVFDLLAHMYQVKIIYDKKDVQNLYLIRKYNNSDSIEYILKEIALLNDLIVTRKDDIFVISK